MANTFDLLQEVNVNGHTEKKKTGNAELTYLSWPFAWAEVKKRFPEAHYEIEKFDGLPYVFDQKTGYMVYTTVTIDGITHEMWLPVMDGANKAMRDAPYKYTTKYGKEMVCEAATMFDINKTIMRCLVKNLAMFGLGLYIFAGEDLPLTDERGEDQKKTEEEAQKKTEEMAAEKIGHIMVTALTERMKNKGVPLDTILATYKLEKLEDMTVEQYRNCNNRLNKT